MMAVHLKLNLTFSRQRWYIDSLRQDEYQVITCIGYMILTHVLYSNL